MHLLALLPLLGATQAFLVPPPPGPYDVAVQHIELVDFNRTDPFAPEANTKRRIMASAYLPIDARCGCKVQVVPYMPALTANIFGKMGESLGVPQGTLEQFEMEFCDISTIKKKKSHETKKEFPLAVFSPGYQGSRLLYGALVRSLASLGYIVVTLDHTYETSIVEFPDGSVVYGDEEPLNATSTLEKLEARTNDESFLIAQLSNTTFTDSLFANFPGTFNPNKIAVYGHSFGGATAAVTVQRDPRAVGGLNFDGAVYGSVVTEGFEDKPFLLVATNSSATSVSLWDEFYSNIGGPKMELGIRDIYHNGLIDVLLLLEVYQLPAESQALVEQVFGKLDGREIEKVVNDIMVGFLDLVFENKTETLEGITSNPHIDVLLNDLRV